jgi:CheY-like chemotaxis protein
MENAAIGSEITNQIIPKGLGLKILIVEDDGFSEMIMTRAVRAFSKETIVVGTGVKAIEACQNNPDIDLVLMDIKMPEMDGHEATRQIRRFNSDVIIIAQTAFALQSDREMAIAAGCTDFISKPINRTKLTLLIEKYFKEQEKLL